MDKFRYFILLDYNGSTFHGWQVQPNSTTVQGVINHAISTLLREEINIVGCGRTDTGVHAKNFIAHFDSTKNNLQDTNLAYKLNAFLPREIVIHKLTKMHSEAHSRFDATERTYNYYISLKKNPFNYNLSLRIDQDLDIEAMNCAAQKLFDYTDFTSFSKVDTDTKTNNCKIKQAIWDKKENKLVFTITADRFLRNMVRAIVGTLLDVGKGKLTTEDFCRIIEAKDRCKAKSSAAGNALFLTLVKYPYPF